MICAQPDKDIRATKLTDSWLQWIFDYLCQLMVMSTPSPSIPGLRGSHDSGGSSSRGRGGRGSVVSRERADAERNMGTIHGDLFTRRPGQNKTGSAGQPRDCVANFVRVLDRSEKTIRQYHVQFLPEVDSKNMRDKMLEQCLEGISFLFDGMILYCVEGTIGREECFSVNHPVSQKEVKINMKVTVEFVANDPQAINVYNLLIRRALKLTECVPIARHFFNPKARKEVKGYNLQLWPGYETSVRCYEDGIMLCVETRWKVLRLDTVYKQMVEVMEGCKQDQEKFHSECKRLFIGQTVITLYNNKMYRISDVDFDMSPSSCFDLCTGQQTTFKEYFESQYNIKLSDECQPLLVSMGKPKQPGEPNQKTYLLPEFCNLTGITDTMRKDQKLMRAMSMVTRLTPDMRFQMTQTLMDSLQSDEKIRHVFAAWEFELDSRLVDVVGRVLPLQKIYGQDSGQGPRAYEPERQTVEWARLVKSNGNFRSADMVNWILLAPTFDSRAEPLATKFIESCKRIGKLLGMKIGDPMCIEVRGADSTDYLQAARGALERAEGHDIHLIAVILSDDNKTRYDALKKLFCLQVPVPSQFVLQRTLQGKATDRGDNKNFDSIVLKIVVQMNCKMGGAPWKVKIPIKDGMIVGYDLYSDSTTKGKCVGACVSSYDEDYTKWYSQTKPHANPTELGTNLVGFMRRCLLRYYQENKKLPSRLFFYRDGVGDGQIPHLRNVEVPQIQEACRHTCAKLELPPDYIQFVFIVVTKKVNVRILQLGKGNGYENPYPGTIVDTVVTRPERYDFYMVPQAVNQGTVTPVSYSIIYDDTSLQPDQHQMLAYKLCHLYYNWQGTIRVPAPCQYAHKLAFLHAQSLHESVEEGPLKSNLYYL